MSRHYHVHDNAPGCPPDLTVIVPTKVLARQTVREWREAYEQEGYRRRLNTGLRKDGSGVVELSDPFAVARVRHISIVPCDGACGE